MCFAAAIPIIIGALAAGGSLVSSQLGVRAQNEAINAQNQASAYAYKQQLDQYGKLQKAVVQNLNEKDSRLRINQQRDATSAFERAQAQIRENQRRAATARATAGSSGLMGLPLNVIDQTYSAAEGGISANLQSTYLNLMQNTYFGMVDNRLAAQNTLNQNAPIKPYMQEGTSLNGLHFLGAAISGLSAGVGAYSGGGGGGEPAETPEFTYEPGVPGNVNDIGPPSDGLFGPPATLGDFSGWSNPSLDSGSDWLLRSTRINEQ